MTSIDHGVTRYRKHGCRCDTCRDAQRRAMRRYRHPDRPLEWEAPVTDADPLRQRMFEVLQAQDWWNQDSAEFVAALLPVVLAHAAERAADELQAAIYSGPHRAWVEDRIALLRREAAAFEEATR